MSNTDVNSSLGARGTFAYRAAEARDVERCCEILHAGFAADQPIGAAHHWLEQMGRQRVRVVEDSDRILGCLALLPFEQFIYGQPVRCVGVHAVAIDPAFRRRGAARYLLQAACRESAVEGFATAMLYASTHKLYRSVGFERAGASYRCRVQLSELANAAAAPADLELAALGAEDEIEVRALYQRVATRRNGHLARSNFSWERIASPYGVERSQCMGFRRSGELVGYVRWCQTPALNKGASDGSYYDLNVLDVVVADAAAAAAVLELLATHRSLGGAVSWMSAPQDPLLRALPERWFQLELTDLWMLRLLSPRLALESRGWPAGVHCRFDLAFVDGKSEERLVLHVAEGRGAVKSGGRGRVRVQRAAGAALFSGFSTPRSLAEAGLLAASEPDLGLLTTAFANDLPWCVDRF